MSLQNGAARRRIHAAFCQALANQPEQADWRVFTPSDWQAALELARLHGLAPLLYHKLGVPGLMESLPEPISLALAELRSHLAQDYYASSAHNQLIYAELGRALTALAEASSTDVSDSTVGKGIPALALKGAALAAPLYGDIALRPMNDLDLLVRREHLQSAAQALISLGYQPFYPEHLGLAGWVDAALNHHLHLCGGSSRNLILELHWSLVAGQADRRSPCPDWFWEQAEPLPLPADLLAGAGGSPPPQTALAAQGLSPTANLLYLAAHLFLQHGAERAIWLWYYDLYLLVQRCGDRIGWDDLPALAAELRWTCALRLGLQAARDWFGASLPPGLLERLDERSAPRLAPLTRTPLTRTADTWQSLQFLDRRTRLRLLLALIFPRPQYMRWRYRPRPAWLWLLYYPWRWLDIAIDALRTLVAKLSQRRLEKTG